MHHTRSESLYNRRFRDNYARLGPQIERGVHFLGTYPRNRVSSTHKRDHRRPRDINLRVKIEKENLYVTSIVSVVLIILIITGYNHLNPCYK